MKKEQEVVEKVIKYIRSGEIDGSFSEGCDCVDCDKYEKKVRKHLSSLITNN